MKKKIPIFILMITLGVLTSLACNIGIAGNPSQVDYNTISTAAAQTVQVRSTLNALQTLVVQITALAPSVQGTPNQPVVQVTQTVAPQAVTSTLVPPTATPVTPPTSAPIVYATAQQPTQTPCNWAYFIEDVSVPDNTAFSPNQPFVKTWRMKNIGSCTWTPDYDLVFSSGEAMGGPVSQQLGKTVAPGKTVLISVSLMAPNNTGVHTGYWMLRSPSGVLFGLGSGQSKAFWVTINVSPLATVSATTPINLVDKFCSAQWTNSLGTILPCPGLSFNVTDGSVTRNDSPKIEIGYQDDEPVLITIPNNGSDGYISGRYPAVTVASGDAFNALTGCLDNSPNCSVTFMLKYSADGGEVQTLSTWDEVYDGNRSRVSINLDSLVGKKVEFILEVHNKDDLSKDDRAFWMAVGVGH